MYSISIRFIIFHVPKKKEEICNILTLLPFFLDLIRLVAINLKSVYVLMVLFTHSTARYMVIFSLTKEWLLSTT